MHFREKLAIFNMHFRENLVVFNMHFRENSAIFNMHFRENTCQNPCIYGIISNNRQKPKKYEKIGDKYEF